MAIEILKLHPARRDSKMISLLKQVMQNITFFKNVLNEFGDETLIKICKNITYMVKPTLGVVFKQGSNYC